MKKRISSAVIRRLPKYLRHLSNLEEAGVERTSSRNLSDITGFTASQIRQDLNHFGGFGQQGYGYNVSSLKNSIVNIIGLNISRNVAIAGSGHLGQAIANSDLFHSNHFQLKALFDVASDLVGHQVAGLEILDISKLEETIKKEEIDILTITTPAKVAQSIADRACSAGVKGIWNYAILDLKLPLDVVLEDVHLNESLFTLSYYMDNLQDYLRN